VGREVTDAPRLRSAFQSPWLAALVGAAVVAASLTLTGNLTVAGTGDFTQLLLARAGLQLASGSGPTIKTITSDPNGAVSGTRGDLLLRTNSAALYQNTDGATAWTSIGSVAADNDGYFGDGSDGACAFDGATTVAGVVPAGSPARDTSANNVAAPATSTYVLDHDVYCSSAVISSGVSVDTGGFELDVRDATTGSGAVTRNGNPASGSTGGASSGANEFAGRIAGGAGGTSGGGACSNGANANNSVPRVFSTTVSAAGTATPATSTAGADGALGVGGAAGGCGGGGTNYGDGCTSGTNTLAPATTGDLRSPQIAMRGRWLGDGTNTIWLMGAGGGGGRYGSSAGGGGGSSGGHLAFASRTIASTISISARGGRGADASGGSGGGGGPGGVIVVRSNTSRATLSIDVSGGNGGTGHTPCAGSPNGGRGGNGYVVYLGPQ
jgi:hypothetical protein